MVIDTAKLYISVCSLSDFDPDSRSQGCEKAKAFHSSYLAKFSMDLVCR